MTSKYQHILRVSAPRLVVSVLSGALLYLAWLMVFLLSRPYHFPLLRGILWALAPLATGLGFSAGAALFIHFRRLNRVPARHILGYPLVGCLAGAALVFPFGPMLIVFGMCLFGSLAMVLFEYADSRRLAPPGETTPQRARIHNDA